jgi:integrase/recombinase XerC
MPAPKLRKTGRITPDAPLPLLIAAFGRFLAASDAAPTTAKNYTGDLARFTRWLDHSSGQASTLESVTPTDLRLYKQALIEEAGWKPASINRTLAALGRFFGWAEEAGLFAGDRPPKLPKAERVERAGPRWLSRREQLALARSVERFGSPRDQAVVTLLLHTGLRVAELCDLTWADVTCWPGPNIRVTRGKVAAGLIP